MNAELQKARSDLIAGVLLIAQVDYVVADLHALWDDVQNAAEKELETPAALDALAFKLAILSARMRERAADIRGEGLTSLN